MTSVTWTIALLALGADPEPAPPTAAEVRPAVARGLGFLEKAGQAWLTERKCIACHHGAFMLRGHNEARQRGIPVDETKLAEWTPQVLTMLLNDKANFDKNKGGQVESTNVLLGQVGAAPADEKTAEMLKAARTFILNAQQEDGSWKYAGQGQDRPGAEANETTTMGAVLALAAGGDDETITASRGRALAWLDKNRTGTGNEALVLRFQLEQKFGDAERARGLIDELLARQNADGDWNWSKTRASDPFARGQSLYALGLAGRGGDDAGVQKAWKYLLAAQRPDGSWFAPTKKPKGDNNISTYWGSAWAVIGLARTLPPVTK